MLLEYDGPTYEPESPTGTDRNFAGTDTVVFTFNPIPTGGAVVINKGSQDLWVRPGVPNDTYVGGDTPDKYDFRVVAGEQRVIPWRSKRFALYCSAAYTYGTDFAIRGLSLFSR